MFEYAPEWLADPDRFSIEPALALTRGGFAPPAGQAIFGSVGDSAPDTWGRRLMQRAERRFAEREGRAVRTLAESDYLLGAADETRLGALRFRWPGEEVFQAPLRAGVPALIELGRLLAVTERILRDEETDEDLQLIFAPSLGGTRPKASVIDQHGRLSIAKFPKETDDYSMETWEEIALGLAGRAGIVTPSHELLQVGGKALLLSRRFDRAGAIRIPFLSAMAMTGSKDGERGSLCFGVGLRDTLDEARSFLSLPHPDLGRTTRHETSPALRGSPESARRLFGISQPISGTVAEAYLRRRGITALHAGGALRFHPRCYYRTDADAPTEMWPALIAAVTDLDGRITGAHRTWLGPTGRDKAPIDTPRRAMGHLLGHGVRFDMATDVMAAGEGIETMLSLRSIMPSLPMIAALSANHLAAILFPAALRRLYVACDSDPAGDAALATLNGRAAEAGIEALELSPALGDFNEDLLGLAPTNFGKPTRPARHGGRGPLHGLGNGRDGIMCPAPGAADRIGS